MQDFDMALLPSNEDEVLAGTRIAPQLPAALDSSSASILHKMFRDPRAIEPDERKDLIDKLRQAVAFAPHFAEIRVLLGMALCVDLQVQQAMEELRAAVRTEPNNFVAQLKFGELLMRLRVCDQAAEHTKEASRLARNAYQTELARRQADKIRTMLREGIERGGYSSLLPRIFRRKSIATSSTPVLVASE